MQETAILRSGVEGCEFMQTRSCVVWASDFPSLTSSFLIYKKTGIITVLAVVSGRMQ